MYPLFTIMFIASICFHSFGQSLLKIPANQSIVITEIGTSTNNVILKGDSINSINVSVLSKAKDIEIGNFNLYPLQELQIMIESGNHLVLKNNSNTKATVRLSSKTETLDEQINSWGSVSFTLRNNSAKSIPLIIPSVMNPNLSPFSSSGVDLKFGQEVFFKFEGKKYLLLTVDNAISNGDLIDVEEKLKLRKKELGLK